MFVFWHKNCEQNKSKWDSCVCVCVYMWPLYGYEAGLINNDETKADRWKLNRTKDLKETLASPTTVLILSEPERWEWLSEPWKEETYNETQVKP